MPLLAPQPAADLLAMPTDDAEEAALELAEREWAVGEYGEFNDWEWM